MKVLRAVPLALLAILACFILTSDADASSDVVQLSEVNPYGDDEGISLHNYGSTDIDLRGYSITDNPSKKSNEGIITFSERLILHAGETLTFCKGAVKDSAYQGRHTTYYNGEKGISFSSKFALKDSGDDVYVFKGETAVDAFCYGNVTIADQGLWSGDSFKTKKEFYAIKIVAGGMSASAWKNTRPGMTEFFFDPSVEYDAKVTPFVFPDNKGIPVYDALENAQKSVMIAIYILSSKNTLALLCELEKRGVDVTLMVEGSPLGDFKPIDYAHELQYLVDCGAEVLFIGADNDRFVYHHAKYCIIDSEKVIITSENWTVDNMNDRYINDPTVAKGNRGWGVIMESKEYADFMTSVFLNDSSRDYGDVALFTDIVHGVTPTVLTYTSPKYRDPIPQYDVTVTPLLSPDSSWDATTYYVSNATSRVYSQQQSLTLSLLDPDVYSPISLMSEKARAGVDTRFILEDNGDDATISTLNASLGIKTAAMGTPYVHNKGVICDDTVIVSSVNWTLTSFDSNRETMVAIHSKEVSDRYAETFIYDFDKNYKYSGLNVRFTEFSKTYPYTDSITVAVEVEQEGTFLYYWYLDDEKKITDDPRTVLAVTEGNHMLRVEVTDTDGNIGYVESSFTVQSAQPSGGISLSDLIPYLPYIAPILLILFALGFAINRIRKGGK
jgi:hypothetical protein